MSGTIISFTTIEFPNEELMENTREIFNVEMKSITERLKPHGMIKFHSSRLFLPETSLCLEIGLSTVIWKHSQYVMKFGKRMERNLPQNMATCLPM